MIPALKKCYVLLNRNFLDLEETIEKINYFPKIELKNSKESEDSKISDMETSCSRINKNCHKLRHKEQTNYSEDIKSSDGEDLDSEFCYDSSCSDDCETAQEQGEGKKQDLSETAPKKLNCSICNKSFSTHLSYLTHKRSHESNPFKCILCKKGCGKRQSFLNHMKKLHPEVDPFVCDYSGCELSFKTLKCLQVHHKMHWRYMCRFCKKLFARKHHMKKHVIKFH